MGKKTCRNWARTYTLFLALLQALTRDQVYGLTAEQFKLLLQTVEKLRKQIDEWKRDAAAFQAAAAGCKEGPVDPPPVQEGIV